MRHVPSQLNPSDDCSRGLMASDLTRDSRWIRGPDFLWQPEEFWPPEQQTPPMLKDGDPEIRTILATQHDSQRLTSVLPDTQRFSKWMENRRLDATVQEERVNSWNTRSRSVPSTLS